MPAKSWNTLSQEEQQAIIAKRKQAMPRTGRLKGRQRMLQRSKSMGKLTKGSRARVGAGQTSKAAAGDSRLTNVTDQQIYLQGVSNSINQIMLVSSTSMYGVGFAYVCAALARGWMTNIANNEYPFAAWQYICQVWQTVMNGTAPLSTTMPYWMWALAAAVAPKTVPKGRGEIYFKALITPATPPAAALYPVGAVAYGYEGTFYVLGSGDTDLFPNAAAPSTPSADVQQQAFLALCGFMKDDRMPSTAMCDSTVKTVFDKDVSAFCTTLIITGIGDQGVGGIAWLASLEVPVHTPLLAPLLTQTTTGPFGSPTRFPARETTFAGDELFVGNLVSTIAPIKHWKTKRCPKIKFIDFLEFQEVIALWLTQLITQYWQDPAQQVTVNDPLGTQQPALTVCPITLQEMGLILRNEILFGFSGTQPGVQGIQPILPSGSGDNQMMPLQVGSTCCAIQSMGMKLPQIIVENLRGLLLHAVKGDSKDIEFLYPAIGKYHSDVLSSGDYQFTSYGVGQEVVLTNTFTAVPPVQRKRRNSKGESAWMNVETETVIDFVDSSNGSVYVFINDPSRLTKLTTMWNEFVSQFAAYSSPLTTFSDDPGINVLCSINQTRYWSVPPSVVTQQALEVRDTRESTRFGLTSLYAGRQVYSQSYREKPFAITAALTSQWILPITLLQDGSNSQNGSAFVKIQALYGEEISSTISTTGSTGPTLASMHANYASQMVHAKGVTSAWDDVISELSREGHAGILSSLAAHFLGNAFGTTVGSVASSIADALPI